MKPAPFEYLRPGSVASAVTALAEVHADGAEAKILAGGQSVLPLLAPRLARPTVLVDVNRAGGLSEVRRVPGGAAGWAPPGWARPRGARFCTPGMLISALHPPRVHPRPDRATIRAAMAGNICRCIGCTGIVDAIEAAAGRSGPG